MSQESWSLLRETPSDYSKFCQCKHKRSLQKQSAEEKFAFLSEMEEGRSWIWHTEQEVESRSRSGNKDWERKLLKYILLGNNKKQTQLFQLYLQHIEDVLINFTFYRR